MGLTNTFITLSEELLNNPNLQHWVQRKDGELVPGLLMALQYYPSRGIYSNGTPHQAEPLMSLVEDLVKMTSLHLSGGMSSNGTRILQEDTVKKMMSRISSNFDGNTTIESQTGFGINWPLINSILIPKGIGWLKGSLNGLNITEMVALSENWKNFIKIYDSEDLFIVALSLGDNTAHLSHENLFESFTETFVKHTDCPIPLLEGQCLVNATFLEGSTDCMFHVEFD